MIATERDAETRAAWQTTSSTLAVDDLVFLDETSTQTTMTRTRGRAPRGRRLHAPMPRTSGPNVTCIAALTITGIRRSLACAGALDGALFAQWVREGLVPGLRVPARS